MPKEPTAETIALIEEFLSDQSMWSHFVDFLADKGYNDPTELGFTED